MTTTVPTIDVFFASRDGQTRRIVERIGRRLGDGGAVARLRELPLAADAEPPGAAAVTVVAAPIRYGFPLPVADRFLRRHAGGIAADRLAVILVNLTARRPGRTTPEGNGYLGKWLKRRRITPAIAAAVAGRLDYPSYRWYDRAMIRLIMRITGGPTDPRTTIEYTDWQQVDSIADAIAALALGTRA
jgi:menaquinone-dependent protoporphyrinogen oxidase